MTPAEIRSARLHLGLTGAQMAKMLDIPNPRTYRFYEAPQEAATHRPLPARAARLIRAYLDGYRPSDWPDRARKARGGV